MILQAIMLLGLISFTTSEGTVAFSDSGKTVIAPKLPSHGPTPNACNLNVSDFLKSIDTMQLKLTNSYGTDLAKTLCDSLRVKANDAEFIFEVPITKSYRRNSTTVREDIRSILSRYPLPTTRLDSASRIVNYVSTNYAQGEGSLLDAESFRTATLEVTGKHIKDYELVGSCGDFSYFTGLIISTLLPSWGTPVDLFSFRQDGKEPLHCIEGIADESGKIYMLLDPIINGIWIDRKTGWPLTLQQLKEFLPNPALADRVEKYSSTISGKYPCLFQEGRCISSTDFISSQNLSSFPVASRPGFFVITGDLFLDDNPDFLGFKLLYAPLWHRKLYPKITWANTVLDMRYISCRDENMVVKICIQNRVDVVNRRIK